MKTLRCSYKLSYDALSCIWLASFKKSKIRNSLNEKFQFQSAGNARREVYGFLASKIRGGNSVQLPVESNAEVVSVKFKVHSRPKCFLRLCVQAFAFL